VRFALGVGRFGSDRFNAGFFAFALDAARGAAFFDAAFFAVARFAAVFFVAGLRAFGFAFFAAIEPPPGQGLRAIRAELCGKRIALQSVTASRCRASCLRDYPATHDR
jgi:hypothetical protein